jgi:hypothetical protein
MATPQSCACFVNAHPAETTEAFLDGSLRRHFAAGVTAVTGRSIFAASEHEATRLWHWPISNGRVQERPAPYRIDLHQGLAAETA